VDAAIIVARRNLVRRPMLLEVSRLLSTTRIVQIGFVETGVSHDANANPGYGYAYGTTYPESPKRGQRARV
jgi:hypothetical protein